MCEGSVESICLTLLLVYTSLEKPVKSTTGELFLGAFPTFLLPFNERDRSINKEPTANGWGERGGQNF